MPPRNRMFFAVLMLVLLFIPAVALFRELSRRSDIWWTPPAMMVPLAEGADRVVVHVRGKPLTALLNGGQLRIADSASTSVVSPKDVGLRFNNWDRIRASRIPILLLYAAVIGAGLMLFALIVSGKLAYEEN